MLEWFAAAGKGLSLWTGRHLPDWFLHWREHRKRQKGPPEYFLRGVINSTSLLTAVGGIVREVFLEYSETGGMDQDDAVAHLRNIAQLIFINRRAFGVTDAEKAGLNVVIYANDHGVGKQPCLRVVARHAAGRYLDRRGDYHPFVFHNRRWGPDTGSWVEGIWHEAGPVWTGKTQEAGETTVTGDHRPSDLKQYRSFVGAPIGTWAANGHGPYGVLLLTTAEEGNWNEPDSISRHLASLLQEQLWMLFLLFEQAGILPLPPLAVSGVKRHPLT